MKERPILFSAPMVCALLAGTKTQTRRVVKPQPRRVDGGVPFGDAPQWAHAEPGTAMMRCPYGKRGDRLWVRETFQRFTDDGETLYKADPAGLKAMNELRRDECAEARWRPAIHMPRWASRITLEITSVRVERLQDIDISAAQAEGVSDTGSLILDSAGNEQGGPIAEYAVLWEQINGPGSWDANPWVWVLEFRRIDVEHSQC
ncbi:MAG: hypothetical protein L6Q63_04005 [Giesbergeria sp.]|nr:hypothetical protein [Giesbergeria sp.]